MDSIQPNRQTIPTKDTKVSSAAPSTQSVAKFNKVLNTPPIGSNFPIINDRPAPDAVLIQNPNTQESYWVPKGAAPDAARAAALGSDLSTNSRPSANVGGEGGGSLFVGVAGVAVSAGTNIDTSGTLCAYGTGCLQVGIGGFLGGSVNGTAGASAPLSSGTTDTWGAFVSAGDGLSANGSINFDENWNTSGVKGGPGPGIGAAAGLQFCRTEAECNK